MRRRRLRLVLGLIILALAGLNWWLLVANMGWGLSLLSFCISYCINLVNVGFKAAAPSQESES